MDFLDYVIFALYMLGVLSIGIFYFFRNKDSEDYYVGGRSINASHVGLSIVATDVGGGFSIGLGGVGFMMGLSGSWLLFTGFIGAWITAVLLIPRIKRIDRKEGMMTYPDFLRWRYNGNVALLAALISGIGYMGFTGAQMLAGAKLASVTILPGTAFGLKPITFSLIIIAIITISYTVLGGLKAVIYTDTIQWALLLSGLIFVTIPVTLYKIGGFDSLRSSLPAEFFSLTNISAVTFVNWMVTIIPIWVIGMTLYQRMYACRNESEAKRAWYIAGIFEWPIMAFTGVFLGMCARVVFPEAESEMAMPMLIRDILPVGVTGIVIASYFSAIMSTADSCLMASSGNFVNDVIERAVGRKLSSRKSIALSMIITLLIGVVSVIIAAQFSKVLDIILGAYAFMVSGLFIPTIGAYFWNRSSSTGAIFGMIGGGSVTLLMQGSVIVLPEGIASIGFDPTLYGILCSLVLFVLFSLLFPDSRKVDFMRFEGRAERDKVENKFGALIQHGGLSDRIYLMKAGEAEAGVLIGELDRFASEKGYTKIFAKVRGRSREAFERAGYVSEARVPGFYRGSEDCFFMGKFFSDERKRASDAAKLDEVLVLAKNKGRVESGDIKCEGGKIRICTKDDAEKMSEIYREVFDSYPFPIDDPNYLKAMMDDNVIYFGVECEGALVALSSAEMYEQSGNVEMTDFATLARWRGRGYGVCLLCEMENRMMLHRGIETSYTIARAISPGMNIIFSKMSYNYAGRLINNTNISGQIESMNIWYKSL